MPLEGKNVFERAVNLAVENQNDKTRLMAALLEIIELADENDTQQKIIKLIAQSTVDEFRETDQMLGHEYNAIKRLKARANDQNTKNSDHDSG